MDCKEFIKIIREWKGGVCIFGAGDYGRTWCYELLKDAGLSIQFYLDNNKVGETCNGLPVYPVERLDKNSDVFVFVSAMGNFEEEMVIQLKELGVENYYHFESDYAPAEFAAYLDKYGNEALISQFPSIMDDETYLNVYFNYRRGYIPDLKNPRLYNEKIQYLKLHDRNPLYTELADKYEMKKYVDRMIGKGHVIPTLFIVNSTREIVYENMPDQFVLKCTHDSGVIICNDKSKFDFSSAIRELDRRMQVNYYWYGREWSYKGIEPRIICEPYMLDESGYELKDYKVFCFDGVPVMIEVDFDRFSNHKRNLFNTNWEMIEGEIEYSSDRTNNIKKPDRLNDLLEYASRLSKGIPHVRTDFYVCRDEIFVGEMTFYHGNGCEKITPIELEEYLGERIDISKVWDKRQGDCEVKNN